MNADTWGPAPTVPLISQLIAKFRRGEEGAVEQLVELLYPELRKMAAARMRMERAPHTWQPTALVHELYLELRKIRSFMVEERSDPDAEKRAFLGLAAYLMKRLLIQHARPLSKRYERLEIESITEPSAAELHLREVDDALHALAAIDPDLTQVTEMKVFGALTTNEIATYLRCSERSVERRWAFARTWLKNNFATDGAQV
jgi:RNA polymerase sigma factor (TIGR02999 family)